MSFVAIVLCPYLGKSTIKGSTVLAIVSSIVCLLTILGMCEIYSNERDVF